MINSPKLDTQMIGKDIAFSVIKDPKFKTNKISINFINKLNENTASANALLPFVLRRGCAGIPDITKLNQTLCGLYGSNITVTVRKVGDYQVITFMLSLINDKFTINQEKIAEHAINILCDIILEPNLQNGCFIQNDIEIEKIPLINIIQSEINNKRYYAVNQLGRIMFADNPYSVNKYGCADKVAALQSDDLMDSYKNMLSSAPIEILLMGAEESSVFRDVIMNRFSGISRNSSPISESSMKNPSRTVSIVNERMDIAQAKLAMGYLTGIRYNDPEADILRTAITILGGTPHSKLFVNVREKLNICYYCSASLDLYKGVVVIDSGIENQNKERAIEEISNQLNSMKNGEITEQEIYQAKLSIITAIKTMHDTLTGTDAWAINSRFCSLTRSVREMIESVENITHEQITEISNKINLDTVFFLGNSAENPPA